MVRKIHKFLLNFYKGYSVTHSLVPLFLIIVGISTSCGENSKSDSNATPLVKVFKSPQCSCCAKWADHLKANGFRVQTTNVVDNSELSKVKQKYGVPLEFETCHTAVVTPRDRNECRMVASIQWASKTSVWTVSKRSLLFPPPELLGFPTSL